MSKLGLFSCLALIAICFPVLAENPENNNLPTSVDLEFSADSEKGRDIQVGGEFFFPANIGVSFSYGTSYLVNEESRNRTSRNALFAVTSNPQQTFVFGAEAKYWGLEDSLVTRSAQLNLAFQNKVWNMSLSPGTGVVDAPDFTLLGRTFAAETEETFFKINIGLTAIQDWRFKIYYEKHTYDKDIENLASVGAARIFTESTLNLASTLLLNLVGAEVLHDLNDAWTVGLYTELSKSAVDQSETLLTTAQADWAYNDHWLYSAKLGRYVSRLPGESFDDPIGYMSLYVKYTF